MPSRHDPAASPADILESVERIEGYLARLDREAFRFRGDALRRDAVERCLERICEGAFRLGKKQPNWRQASPGAISVAWATDSSHAYDRIDLDILWNTVRDRLPSLRADAEQALVRLKAQGGG